MWASVVVVRGLSSCGFQALECRLSSGGCQGIGIGGNGELFNAYKNFLEIGFTQCDYTLLNYNT